MIFLFEQNVAVPREEAGVVDIARKNDGVSYVKHRAGDEYAFFFLWHQAAHYRRFSEHETFYKFRWEDRQLSVNSH